MQNVWSGVGQSDAEQATLGLCCPMETTFGEGGGQVMHRKVTRFTDAVSDGWLWVGG